MSVSVWSEEKNCFVLGPMKKEIINAFHPDYVKTYHPELLSSIRVEATQKANGLLGGGISKKKRETKNIAANTVNTQSKKVDLAVKQYYTYARAGMPKGVKN